MSKYKSTSEIVDAIQYNDNLLEVREFIFPVSSWVEGSNIVICKLTGNLIATTGDWVVKKSAREITVCSPELFSKIYIKDYVEAIAIASSLAEFNAMIDRLAKKCSILNNGTIHPFKSSNIQLSDLEDAINIMINKLKRNS